jgi:hypothetical protein
LGTVAEHRAADDDTENQEAKGHQTRLTFGLEVSIEPIVAESLLGQTSVDVADSAVG